MSILNCIKTGIGFKLQHYEQLLMHKKNNKIDIDFIEIHTENFFHLGSKNFNILSKIRDHYPVSLHGVGLSLGSGEIEFNATQFKHLKKIKDLKDSIKPFLISEHLSWSYINFNSEQDNIFKNLKKKQICKEKNLTFDSKIKEIYLPDLIPAPYNDESFEIFTKNINFVQNFLDCQILIENPSSYIQYKTSKYKEANFLADLCKKTNAGILLDLNNVFVSSFNHGWDPYEYLSLMPIDLIKEIHLAGHSKHKLSDDSIILIDTHDDYICDNVWVLYQNSINIILNQKEKGFLHSIPPILIEWDEKIPTLEALITESHKAKKIQIIK